MCGLEASSGAAGVRGLQSSAHKESGFVPDALMLPGNDSLWEGPRRVVGQGPAAAPI